MLYLARDALKLQLFLTPQIHARCVDDVIQKMQAVLTTLSANITQYWFNNPDTRWSPGAEGMM